MSSIIIKTGTTAISGAVVKGSFSYFSGSTKDLGPTSSTGFYNGIDAPSGGYTVYQVGGTTGWTARAASDTSTLNSILIAAGATGSTTDQRITWANNTNSIWINSGATIYTIGQSALGGVIAYINGGGTTGTTGLVATTADISSGAQWGCYGTTITGADGTAIGTGNQNTIDIMAGCATAGIAARLCGDLVQGGYSDWYLPSKDELNQLYLNRVAIGGFQNASYWSSSEVDANTAWYQLFYNSGQLISNAKINNGLVRAVRSF
jgi:hypothetical protein